jgi:hypothetical protein
MSTTRLKRLSNRLLGNCRSTGPSAITAPWARTFGVLIVSGALLGVPACDDAAETKPASPATTSDDTSALAAAAPRISAPEPVFEFGSVKEGAIVEHTFKLVNTGTSELHLTGAKGS